MSMKPGETPVRHAEIDLFCGGRGWTRDADDVPFLVNHFLVSNRSGKLVLFLDEHARITIERNASTLYWETTDGWPLKVTTALMVCGGLSYEGKTAESIAEAARIFAAKNMDDAKLILACEKNPKVEIVLKRFKSHLYA